MLAEIFMVRLEMLLRVASSSAAPQHDPRFVPYAPPSRETDRKAA
jgi:hypothetical protein